MTTLPGSLIWGIVKRNKSILVKEFGIGNPMVQMSKESNNLYNVNSFKHSDGEDPLMAETEHLNMVGDSVGELDRHMPNIVKETITQAYTASQKAPGLARAIASEVQKSGLIDTRKELKMAKLKSNFKLVRDGWFSEIPP